MAAREAVGATLCSSVLMIALTLNTLHYHAHWTSLEGKEELNFITVKDFLVNDLN